jgi:hypothetical protein
MRVVRRAGGGSRCAPGHRHRRIRAAASFRDLLQSSLAETRRGMANRRRHLGGHLDCRYSGGRSCRSARWWVRLRPAIRRLIPEWRGRPGWWWRSDAIVALGDTDRAAALGLRIADRQLGSNGLCTIEPSATRDSATTRGGSAARQLSTSLRSRNGISSTDPDAAADRDRSAIRHATSAPIGGAVGSTCKRAAVPN